MSEPAFLLDPDDTADWRTDPRRRMVVTYLTADLFPHLFATGTEIRHPGGSPDRTAVVSGGIPDGAEVVDVRFDPVQARVAVYLRHPSFEAVPLGGAVRAFDILCQSWDTDALRARQSPPAVKPTAADIEAMVAASAGGRFVVLDAGMTYLPATDSLSLYADPPPAGETHAPAVPLPGGVTATAGAGADAADDGDDTPLVVGG